MKIAVKAYLDNNLGDDLMITLMANRFPQHEFILYTKDSLIMESFKHIKNIVIKPNFTKEDLTYIDAYVIIGGSIFQLDSFIAQIRRLLHINQLRKIRKRNIPIATIGCNLGPYCNNIGIKLTKFELKYNDLVTVRDKYSYDLIKSFKKIKNFYLADDIVYNFIDNLHVNNKNGLGICAYRSLKFKENNLDNYNALAKIADIYIEKTKKRVKLFAFDSGSENDIAAAYYIYKLAEKKEYIDIIPYISNQDEFLKEFKSVERMIAIRFHSAILADIFRIPFLPIIYSNKMENFLKDRGYTGIAIKTKNLNMNLNIDNIVNKIILGEEIFNNFIKYKGNSKIHFDELEKLLKKI